MFIYFWERERVEEGQKEKDIQNLKQAPGFELSAQSPTWGSNPATTRSWPELKLEAEPADPPRCPENSISRENTEWNANLYKDTKSIRYQGAWVAQSVECPTSAQVMISWFVSLSPASGSVLTAQSLERASDSVSPSLSAPSPIMLCLSLSKLTKH